MEVYDSNGFMPVYSVSWGPDYADPDDYATPMLDSFNGVYPYFTGYANASIDDLVREAAAEVDEAVRIMLLNRDFRTLFNIKPTNEYITAVYGLAVQLLDNPTYGSVANISSLYLGEDVPHVLTLLKDTAVAPAGIAPRPSLNRFYNVTLPANLDPFVAGSEAAPLLEELHRVLSPRSRRRQSQEEEGDQDDVSSHWSTPSPQQPRPAGFGGKRRCRARRRQRRASPRHSRRQETEGAFRLAQF